MFRSCVRSRVQETRKKPPRTSPGPLTRPPPPQGQNRRSRGIRRSKYLRKRPTERSSENRRRSIIVPPCLFSEAHSLRILDGAVNRMAPELFDRVRVRRTRWNHCGRTPVADLTRLRLPAPAARSGRDDVAPFQPAVQVDVSAALRAERIIALAARLPAHRAGPLALAWTRSPSRGFVVVRGHRAGLASQLRWTS